MKGVLELFSETGTEGGFWAFQDEAFIKDNDHWDIAGLHILEDGDQLTIFDKDNPEKILWEGVIKLKRFPVFTEHVFGLWIHSDQEGVRREIWGIYFMENYPAELKK